MSTSYIIWKHTHIHPPPPTPHTQCQMGDELKEHVIITKKEQVSDRISTVELQGMLWEEVGFEIVCERRKGCIVPDSVTSVRPFILNLGSRARESAETVLFPVAVNNAAWEQQEGRVHEADVSLCRQSCRRSQYMPAWVTGHWHRKEPGADTHTPPFKHGWEVHRFTLVSHCVPETIQATIWNNTGNTLKQHWQHTETI